MTLRGLDAYLTREPREDGPDPQREEEQVRLERWAEFVAWLRDLGRTGLWDVVLRRVTDAYGDPGGAAEDATIVDFAETEGWPGVLSAVARAMTEQAAEAAEIERRR